MRAYSEWAAARAAKSEDAGMVKRGKSRPGVSHLRFQGLRFRVQGLRFRVEGWGFRVQGLGFRVSGSGFRVGG